MYIFVRIVRVFLCYCFLFLSGAFLLTLVAHIWPGTTVLDNLSRPLTPLEAITRYLAFLAMTIIFGVASWVAWRERRSESHIVRGRVWVMAASILAVLIFVGSPFAFYNKEGMSAVWQFERLFAIPTGIVILGLIAFSPAWWHLSKNQK